MVEIQPLFSEDDLEKIGSIFGGMLERFAKNTEQILKAFELSEAMPDIRNKLSGGQKPFGPGRCQSIPNIDSDKISVADEEWKNLGGTVPEKVVYSTEELRAGFPETVVGIVLNYTDGTSETHRVARGDGPTNYGQKDEQRALAGIRDELARMIDDCDQKLKRVLTMEDRTTICGKRIGYASALMMMVERAMN